MDNQPKITVIVPTHNSGKYIEKCLDSVQVQSFTNFEVLCIDSSLKDNTKEILSRYQIDDDRFFVIEDDNSSYGHKMNVGIEKARGEFIAILESDDLLRDDMLEILYHRIEKTNIDFVKCDYLFFADFNSQELTFPRRCFSKEIYNRILTDKEGPLWWNGAHNHIWTGLYRKSYLESNRIEFNESPGASYQDTGFSILCNAYARSVCFIPEALYMYRVDNESSSVKSNDKYNCIRDEYDWIGHELFKRGIDNEEFIKFVVGARDYAFVWNLRRLDEKYRIKFLTDLKLEQVSNSTENRVSYLPPINEELLQTSTQKAIDDDGDCEKIIKTLASSNSSILFGTGRYGEYVMSICELFSRSSIVAACDNSKEKQGSKFHGLDIVSPETAIKEYPQSNIIISIKKDAQIIREWLNKRGVDNSRLCVVNNEMDPEAVIKWAIREREKTI